MSLARDGPFEKCWVLGWRKYKKLCKTKRLKKKFLLVETEEKNLAGD